MIYFTTVYVFIQIILGLFAFGVLWRKNGWHTHTNTAASILTIIGVCGTFGGICLGLWGFEIENIEGSIPTLLDSLKLAFLTSLVGIFSAIVLKVYAFSQTIKSQDPDEETIDKFVTELTNTLTNVQTSGEINLLAQMVTLNTAIREEGKETRVALGGIKEDLTGIHTSLTGGQNETVAQLRGLTTTVSEKHDHLTSTVVEKHDNLISLHKEEGNQTREGLTNLQAAFTDGQSALSTQLENLATTFSTKHDFLIDEFQTFSKNVAESVAKLATDELIGALKTVIEDFNAKITEQFGENFKQLNEAVGKTVTWQEQYRQQMDKLADEFRLAAKSINDSRDSLENIADSSSTIADKSGSIVTSAAKLEPILHTLNDQLGAFRDLRQKANDAFPIIEGHLDALTTKFSGAVQTAITDSQAQSQKLTNQYAEFQKVIDGLDDFTTKIDKVTTDVSNIVKDLEASIDFQKKAFQNSASYVTTMESKLDAQLTASINALGTNLAALSEKFVDDYTPLTQSLRQVLTIADGILPKRSGN